MKHNFNTLTLLFAVALMGQACATNSQTETVPAASTTATPAATPAVQPTTVPLQAAKGSKVTGTVQFAPAEKGVKVIAHINGLKPNSKHGFHIHETGACSDPAFKSAGGHWNPTGTSHGGPQSQQKHIGDLGNLTADAKGHAMLEQVIENASLASGDMSIIGRAVVVHQKADDLKSNPSGNSGDRIACGVISAAQ